MDKSEAINIAKDYKRLVCQYIDVKDVILYGSYSNGTPNENSDIDIAVVVDELKGDYFDTVPLLWKLRRQVNNLIEPILISKKNDKSGFLGEIVQNGIFI